MIRIRRKRNWLGETRKDEQARRLEALEGARLETETALTVLKFKVAKLEAQLNPPPPPTPEES